MLAPSTSVGALKNMCLRRQFTLARTTHTPHGGPVVLIVVTAISATTAEAQAVRAGINVPSTRPPAPVAASTVLRAGVEAAGGS